MEPLLFEVLAYDPHLDLQPGDILAVDLRRSRMWASRRILQPNYGYVAGLIATEVIAWITPSHAVQEAITVPMFPIQVVA